MPPNLPQARRHRLIALLVFATSLALLGALSWQFEQNRAQTQRALAQAVAADQAQVVASRIQRLLTPTYLMAAMVRANPTDLSLFQPLAAELLPQLPGVTAISLSPGGVVRHVAAPDGSGQRLLNFDQLNDPIQGPEARRTRDSGELTLAGPLQLWQGGHGVVARLPIFLPNPHARNGNGKSFWGFTNVAIRFPDGLANAGFEKLANLGYHYELWRAAPDGARLRIAASWDASAASPLRQPINKTIAVPGGEWVLSLAPVNGWHRPIDQDLTLYLLASALFSLLLATLVKLLLEQRLRGVWLEQEVQARLKDVNAARSELQATLAAVPDLLFDLDANGVFHGVQAQNPQDLLAPAEQVLGRRFQDLLPPEAAAAVEAALLQASQQGRSLGLQYALPLPSGERWFELSISAKAPAAAANGAPQRFVALARDITERKQAENQHQLASQFFQGSSEGLMITDAQQRIIQVNPAFTSITGYTAPEVLGHTPSLLSAGLHDAAFYAAMWQEIEQQGHWQGEILNRRRNGDSYPEWLSISRVQNSAGATTNYVAIFSDMSRRREQEARIRQLAYYDPLTGLANRTLLRERVQHDLGLARRQNAALSLLFIDLDHFKQINDSLGHMVGDQLLKQVALRLGDLVREQDTVARLGGDEFIAVLPDTGATGATHLAQLLLERLSEPYTFEQQELTVTPSIGIAIYPDDGDDFETLYRCADTAMYRAKQEGRRRYAFYQSEMQLLTARRLQLENALRRAVERDELSLHYQPQARLADGQVVGAEALLRWQHPELGALSPTEFIPIAEASGLILPIGEWVLRQACAQARRWLDAGWADGVVAVNLSALQFRQPHLAATVESILREAGLPAQHLELELTESMATDDPQAAIAVMNELRQLGLRLSVDDFGTGYSSLNHLKRFKVHKLKIDQSFVRGLQDNAEDASIVETIIQMGHNLGMAIIAEGVETPFQQAFLRERGCDEMQGYLLARPLPADDFGAWLRARRPPQG